ncbi:MAG: hypothetical protein M3Q89_05340 [Verrucomicrobiota bacterium]|nr:hypothetical protein [Verrucomicrobiota bacterium]
MDICRHHSTKAEAMRWNFTRLKTVFAAAEAAPPDKIGPMSAIVAVPSFQ